MIEKFAASRYRVLAAERNTSPTHREREKDLTWVVTLSCKW
jgi:hypothetical protein